ncbi:MAG: Two-component transcriptional response regulator, LuxR family [uncultured Corynebacteriales bacterium]|uniref:Two-component transcriptional response regulator, LuxR family n=1 Tax=uncultured Mycobacteriales bacterium TaxID=581187 RepID=A0A6J4K0N2_9ACTN|nr:MAG: Two-component transcriptional response regulator, LuxR family [uncultured Corynebacteriales bacterium]
MITVLIVDDEWMVRAMLRTIMGACADIEVVGEAADGAEAVRRARELAPDVVLMDIRMPRADGLAATAALARLLPPPKVVVLTTFDLDEYVETALRHGAVGFLLKDATAEQLAAAVRSAAAGDAMLSPQVTRRLLRRFAEPGNPHRADARRRLDVLTAKEREVLAALAEGLANGEIGRRLHLSEATVKSHVSRLLAKLQLTNRVQAAILAHRAGLVA